MEDENVTSMDQVSAHIDRGWDLLQRGDLPGALASAKRGLELDAESPEAHYLVGYIHAQEGSPEEALEHYEHALELDETFYEAVLNAAEVLLHALGNHKEAMRYVESAIDLAETPEETADALLLKIDAQLLAGDEAGARRTVALLPREVSDNPQLEFLIARASFEAGLHEGVEERLRRALAAEPHHADALYYLGLCLDHKHDHRGATVSFLQTRELDLRQPPVPWSLTSDLFERKVQAVIQRLAAPYRNALEGALVVVVDSPGAEIVADGVDPRAIVLLDALGPAEEPPQVGRLFVYQRNVERAAPQVHAVEDEILRGIERELTAAYPNAYSDTGNA